MNKAEVIEAANHLTELFYECGDSEEAIDFIVKVKEAVSYGDYLSEEDVE